MAAARAAAIVCPAVTAEITISALCTAFAALASSAGRALDRPRRRAAAGCARRIRKQDIPRREINAGVAQILGENDADLTKAN